jgi:hypothetical protein
VQEEYSNTLEELYDYMQQQLIRAHRDQSEAILQEVSRLLNTLLEGWLGAMNAMNSATTPGNDPERRPASLEHAEPVSASSPYSWQPAGSSSDCRSWQF